MAQLADRLLTEEIRSLHSGRRSGILEVTSGTVTKGIFLRRGRVVFASSTLDADKLGENLIRRGRISRAEFAAAYQSGADQGTRLGQALVGAGLLTEDELGALVVRQVETIVLSLFTWTRGEMHFHATEEPIPEDLAIDLSTHRLLLEGVRVYPDVEPLERAIGRQDRTLRPSARPPFDFRRIPLTPAETTVLHECEAGVSVRDVLAGPTPRPLLVRGLYALLASGLLEEAGAQAAAEPEEDARTFRLAGIPSSGPAAGPRDELLALYEALPRTTHYDVLGLDPGASAAEIVSAHTRLASAQDRRWGPLASDPALGSVIAKLQGRRREAFDVLSDPARRAAYDRSLGRVPVAAPPTPVAQRPRPEEPPPARPQPPRQQPAAAARAGGTPGPAGPAPPAPPARPETVPELLAQAQKLIEKGEGEHAVPLLLKAVERDPRNAPVRRVLAKLLARHPSLSHTAERHFLAALEMDPNDTELRYHLALYYKRAGLAARAVLHLKIVVGRDPNHPAAWRELSELEGGIKGR